MMKSGIAIFAMAIALPLSVTAQQGADKNAKITEALRAAPSGIAQHATVKDWDGTVLRKGNDVWTCFPSPESMPNSPMCMDAVWAKWGEAWMNKKPFKADRIGLAYMLMGDSGGSNTDPYAPKPTPDNKWVVEGPHLMIIAPDAKMLAGISDDPYSGGPYVMWRGTPYEHIMVPVR